MGKWWWENGMLRTAVPSVHPSVVVVVPDVVGYLAYMELGQRVWRAWR